MESGSSRLPKAGIYITMYSDLHAVLFILTVENPTMESNLIKAI